MKGAIEVQSIITVITLHYYISGQGLSAALLIIKIGDGVEIKPNLPQPSLQTPTQLSPDLNSWRFISLGRHDKHLQSRIPQGQGDTSSPPGSSSSGGSEGVGGWTPEASLALGHLASFPFGRTLFVLNWSPSHNAPGPRVRPNFQTENDNQKQAAWLQMSSSPALLNHRQFHSPPSSQFHNTLT